MDKTGLITNSKGNIRNLAVDGLIFGVLSGLGMYLVMTVLVLFSRNSVTTLLERFSTGAMTSPLQGLFSHLAVSAIYGMLFGALIWPILQRFSATKTHGLAGWLGIRLAIVVSGSSCDLASDGFSSGTTPLKGVGFGPCRLWLDFRRSFCPRKRLTHFCSIGWRKGNDQYVDFGN